MIDILILSELYNGIHTMYGISKEISKRYSALLIPSFGTIKPALKKMEKSGWIKTQKSMSEGGRLSIYYSITNDGKIALKELILQEPVENPLQFMATSRVKLSCANILDDSAQEILYKRLLLKTENLIADTKNMVSEKKYDYHRGIVLDNLLCEYNNFASMLKGLTNVRNNK